MIHKLIKNITLKNGTTLTKGASATIVPIAGNNRLCEVTVEGKTYKLRYESVFKAPSEKTLMKWEWDSCGAKTPSGKMVEQDGHDEYGFPAWTLIIGVI